MVLESGDLANECIENSPACRKLLRPSIHARLPLRLHLSDRGCNLACLRQVPFCVHLCDVRMRMPKYDLGLLQTELLSDECAEPVSETVRIPRSNADLAARSVQHGTVRVSPVRCTEFRGEQRVCRVTREVVVDHILRIRAQQDHPGLIAMLRLVCCRPIFPDLVRRIDVTLPSDECFPRTTSCVQLETNDTGEASREMREDGFDIRKTDGANWIPLPNFQLPSPDGFGGLERNEDIRWNEPPRDAPLHGSTESANVLIDCPSVVVSRVRHFPLERPHMPRVQVSDGK